MWLYCTLCELFTETYNQDNHKIIDKKEYLGKLKLAVPVIGEIQIILISKLFNVSTHVFEYLESEEYYRFLYKQEIKKEFISHCIIHNHTYNEKKSKHFEKLTVNQLHFNAEKYNSINFKKEKIEDKVLDNNINLKKNYITELKNNINTNKNLQ